MSEDGDNTDGREWLGRKLGDIKFLAGIFLHSSFLLWVLQLHSCLVEIPEGEEEEEGK